MERPRMTPEVQPPVPEIPPTTKPTAVEAPARALSLSERLKEIDAQKAGAERVVREMREFIYGSCQNTFGENITDVYALADRMAFESGADAQKISLMAVNELQESENATFAEVMSVNSGVRFDDKALMDKAARLATEAGLPAERIGDIRKMAARAAEVRNCIMSLRQETGTDRELFRLLFGRYPKGEIEIIDGPLSLHVACGDIEDYTLIHSGAFAEEKADGSPRQITLGEIERAKKTGGVAIWNSRAESLFLDKDPGLDDPITSANRVIFRQQALAGVRGAVTAERGLPRDPGRTWRIFRHEERHVINRLIAETWSEPLIARLRRHADEMADLEAVIDANGRWLKSPEADKDPQEAERVRNQNTALNAELDSLVKTSEGLVRRFAENVVEDMARDEILAYFAENRLKQAIGPDTPKGGPRTYLRETGSDSLYDFHGGDFSDEIRSMTMYRLSPVIQGGPGAKVPIGPPPSALMRSAGSGTAGGERAAAMHSPANPVEAQIDFAVKQHHDRYGDRLDKSYQAIQSLKESGLSRDQILDRLSTEPLRNWPFIARLEERKKTKKK